MLRHALDGSQGPARREQRHLAGIGLLEPGAGRRGSGQLEGGGEGRALEGKRADGQRVARPQGARAAEGPLLALQGFHQVPVVEGMHLGADGIGQPGGSRRLAIEGGPAPVEQHEIILGPQGKTGSDVTGWRSRKCSTAAASTASGVESDVRWKTSQRDTGTPASRHSEAKLRKLPSTSSPTTMAASSGAPNASAPALARAIAVSRPASPSRKSARRWDGDSARIRRTSMGPIGRPWLGRLNPREGRRLAVAAPSSSRTGGLMPPADPGPEAAPDVRLSPRRRRLRRPKPWRRKLLRSKHDGGRRGTAQLQGDAVIEGPARFDAARLGKRRGRAIGLEGAIGPIALVLHLEHFAREGEMTQVPSAS